MPSKQPLSSVRIDKWLWAARFYKTRQLAVKAIKNGKVSINSQRIKPAAQVKTDDLLLVKRDPYQLEIVVCALSEHRGSATIAQALYKETDDSISAKIALQRQLASQPKIQVDRQKPDKRAVRTNRAVKRGE